MTLYGAIAACLCFMLQPNPSAEPVVAPSPETAPESVPTSSPVRRDEHPEVVLTLKDGSVFQGLLVKQDEKVYVIEIVGIATEFKAGDVNRVRELPPVLERYKELRDAVPVDDVEKRIELIQWLADRRQAELASAECDLLLMKHPKHGGLTKLRQRLDLELDLVAEKPIGTEKPEKSEPTKLVVKDFPLLTGEQINLMKVYELDLTSNPPPTVSFPREAAKAMLDEFASNPLVPASKEERDDLLRQEPLRLVELMFRLKARDYYGKVKVVDQPAPIKKFRDEVHRVSIINACATSDCHGGTEAGRLVLSNFRPNTDPSLYTNLYILQLYRTRTNDPLINWEQPERSPLLQMGLPRESSRLRHPVVLRNNKDAWRPAFASADDRRFQAALSWIRSMYRPRPDYSMEYVPFRPLTPPPPPAPKKAEKPVER